MATKQKPLHQIRIGKLVASILEQNTEIKVKYCVD